MVEATFNRADYLAFAFILIGTLLGLRRGLSGRVAFLLVSLIVIATASAAHTPCYNWLAPRLPLTPEQTHLVALVIVIIAPLAILLLLRHLLAGVLRMTFAVWVDRLGGGLCGFIGASMFMFLLFLVLSLAPQNMRPRGIGDESWICRRISGIRTSIAENILSRVRATRGDLEKSRDEHTRQRNDWWVE